MNNAATAIAKPFEVTLPDFIGPMDLLVFLVKQREIDVACISVAALAEDYLKWWQARLDQLEIPADYYLDSATETHLWGEGLDLDQAGEFVLMAAILLEFKAISLLPTEEPDWDGIELGTETPWSPEELAMFQIPAGHLAALETTQVNLFDRGSVHISGLDLEITSDMFSEVAVYDLAMAFSRLNRELPPENQHIIEATLHTIEGQTGYILSFFERARQVSFERLAAGLFSRIAVVITFLALLELIRLGRVAVRQSQTFGQLWVISTDSV